MNENVFDCRINSSIAGANPGDYVVTATDVQRLYADGRFGGLRMQCVVEDYRSATGELRKALEAAGILTPKRCVMVSDSHGTRYDEKWKELQGYENTVHDASVYAQ